MVAARRAKVVWYGGEKLWCTKLVLQRLGTGQRGYWDAPWRAKGQGLVFSHALVEYAVVSVLMSYLTQQWKASLPKAAAVVNVNESLTSIMAIVSSHISDAYLGRFKMLLFTNAAYTIGLVLLYISGSKVAVFYMALPLIMLGKVGREPHLKAFFADQFKAQDDNDERAEYRRKTWWRSFGFLGILVATFALPNFWPNILKISASLMGATYVMFLCGYSFYKCIEPTESPLTLVFRVFVAATLKRRLEFPGHVMLPRTRWLYKAVLEEEGNKGRLFTITQVEEATHLLEMIPMWTTFLVYGLVKSTGSTFFIEQAEYVNGYIGNIEVGATFLIVIKSISSFAISFMFELLVPQRLTESQPRYATRLRIKLTESQRRYATHLRIGVGMLFSIFSCVTAWRVEARRLQAINAISILWLAPQFCLLGVMEGFAENGLMAFFSNQVSESMENYGPPFNECVIGIGSLLSVLSVHLFRDLFGENVDESRLDKYYRNLVIFSFTNLVLYCFISSRYQYEEVLEVELTEVVEEGEVEKEAAEIKEVVEEEVTEIIEVVEEGELTEEAEVVKEGEVAKVRKVVEEEEIVEAAV
ncbi:hypothetical protein HHK36_023153 [Tetracentron sinense]|uniref:Uncharacterized protein n=1 Tax=Tetracentron sinense TaxID=13715 RepID=A0A834YKS7_TETSI|nr:hypothetical protein HHK36_023153 [Tetracentron sinense]